MPGRDWRSAIGVPQAAPKAPAPAAPRLPELPDPVRRLLEERRLLEARMREVTGGGDPRLASIYEVRPLAERRAELETWARSRQQEAGRAVGSAQEKRAEEKALASARLDGPRPAPRPPVAAPLPLRPTVGETLRPRTRPTRRSPSESDAFMAARENVGESVSSLARQSRDLDAQRDRLRREGKGDAADAIDRALADTGVDRLLKGADKLDRTYERGATTAKAPERAVRVVEDDWQRRRDRIGGADLDRYQRRYTERAARLLNVDTGTIDQLQDRMQRQRDRSLDRRRAVQDEQRRDDDRRDRALARRQARRKEDR